MRILKANDESLKEAVKVLKSGGVIIYPTDTLYGLGVDATSNKAKKKIYKIKGRDFRKPFSMCVADLKHAKNFVEFDNFSSRLAKKFLPGPLTLVLSQKKEIKYVSQKGKIAVRIPDNSFILKLLKKFGKPITATSANLSGEKDPIKLSDINDKVKSQCDLIIDGGKCKFKKPSTVFDAESKKILREGAISKSKLARLKFI
jgi:L-threonylcarbamoyladenylate synthase